MILNKVKERIPLLSTKKVTLGFDGFVDDIVKVVRSKEEHSTSYFNSISEFGDYVLAKNEKNFAVELESVITKIGGNMPIMANALSQLGPIQSCVGALGFPQVHPVFTQMPSNCKVYSFANPGFTKAMEFNGAKIMLAEMGDLNHVDWNTIKEVIGIEPITQLFTEPDLVCLLNWSEIKNSNTIWKGLLTDILQKHSIKKETFAFVDLADCSRKSSESIMEAIELLNDFSAHWKVVLGLNLNEAIHLYKILKGQELGENEIETVGRDLYEQLSIHSLVIHYSKQALAWDNTGLHRKNSKFIANPQISTGAGDNFNAGYCAGLLMDLDAETSLLLGHAASHYYMQNGKSPGIAELLNTIDL